MGCEVKIMVNSYWIEVTDFERRVLVDALTLGARFYENSAVAFGSTPIGDSPLLRVKEMKELRRVLEAPIASDVLPLADRIKEKEKPVRG